MALAPDASCLRDLASPRHGGYAAGRAVKRGLDIVVSALALLLLLPVFAVIALMIVAESPGPVFYRAERVGLGGRRLLMLKFRKMWPDVGALKLTVWHDSRLTRVGTWLAVTKMDELPQLWNVLRGDMSLVGPRPEDPAFAALDVDAYRQILSVRPGLIGLSQLAFADERRVLSEDDPIGHYAGRILPQKISLDLLYARHRTLRLDLRIVMWTLVVMFLGQHVAVHRGSGRMSRRRRANKSLREVRAMVRLVPLAVAVATVSLFAIAPSASGQFQTPEQDAYGGQLGEQLPGPTGGAAPVPFVVGGPPPRPGVPVSEQQVPRGGGGLPFTGVELGVIGLVGALLLGTGLAMRRVTASDG